MNDARADGLYAVRSSLRTLAFCAAASAVVALTSRLAYTWLLDRIRSGAAHDYSVIEAVSTLSRASGLALALVSATAIGRLGALPPSLIVPAKETAARAPPYRAAPGEAGPTSTIETAPGVVALARWASVAAWSACGIEVIIFTWDALTNALVISHHKSSDSLHVVDLAIWLLSSLTAIAATGLLVVWMIRVARDLSRDLLAPVPVIVLGLVACRGAFWIWRLFTETRLSDGVSWAATMASVVIDVCMALILAALARGLGALPQDEGDAGDAAERGRERDAEARWEEAGLGLSRYAGALKARIALAICGWVLVVVANLAGEREVARALSALTPIATLIVGVVMIDALVRYARLPADTRAGGLAMIAIGLLAASWLAEVYDIPLVAQILQNRHAGDNDAVYIETAAQGLGLGGLLALLASLGRLGASMGEASLVSRARSLAVFLAVATAGAIGMRIAIAEGSIAVGGMLAVALATLVVAIVALSKYLGLIGDLRAVMARRTARKLA